MQAEARMRPTDQALVNQGYTHTAWTGGCSPAKRFLDRPERERAICRDVFRKHCGIYTAHWKEAVPLGIARTFWCWSRGDAYATVRQEGKNLHGRELSAG